MEHICFTEEVPNQDVLIQFQLLLLERQIYIWVGLGVPNLGNLCIATPTRLVGGNAASHVGMYLAEQSCLYLVNFVVSVSAAGRYSIWHCLVTRPCRGRVSEHGSKARYGPGLTLLLEAVVAGDGLYLRGGNHVLVCAPVLSRSTRYTTRVHAWLKRSLICGAWLSP